MAATKPGLNSSSRQNGVEGTARRSNAVAWFLGILLALGLAWTFRVAASVMLPIAVALFVALCVWPVCRWVQQRVPKRLSWLGHIAALSVALLFVALFVAGLVLVAQQINGRVPQDPDLLREEVTRMIEQSGLGGVTGGTNHIASTLGKSLQTIGTYTAKILGAVTSTVLGLVVVFFLVLLMLIEAPAWRTKLASLDGGGGSRWDEAVAMIGRRFRKYFLTRLLLGAITGLLYAGFLALFGVDLLIVWGLLALLLNFIPNVGSLIAGALPVIYVSLTRDPATAAMIAAGLLVIEQVMGNYVDPLIVGRQLAISPLVTLIALLFWSWIWGLVGALLSAPMTVLLIIVFAHIPALRPVALLLSNEKDQESLMARNQQA